MFSTHSSPVLKGSSPARNAFISSTKSVHPQHKKHSSLTIKMFVQCDSYLEMSSKDYLVASSLSAAEIILSLAINAFVFFLEVGLETPKKEQKLGGETVSFKNLISSRDKAEKSTETRQR